MLGILKKIPIHPSFFLLFLWFALTGQITSFFALFFVVLVHEGGHYIVAKKLGYRLTSFYLAPYGVALNYKDGKFLPNDEVKIALAGPCANLALSVLLSALWWIVPASYSYTYLVSSLSFFLALTNLLPAYPLDGGRVFVSLLSEKYSRKKACKISLANNIIFSILFFAGFVVTCFVDFNPTLALMSVFLFMGGLETKFEGKYEHASVFKKVIKNFSSVKTCAVDESVTLKELMMAIDQTKLTIFYIQTSQNKIKVLTEKQVLNLVLVYPLSLKLCELNLKEMSKS